MTKGKTNAVVGGVSPSGNISITSNGRYNVANYQFADVSVSLSFSSEITPPKSVEVIDGSIRLVTADNTHLVVSYTDDNHSYTSASPITISFRIGSEIEQRNVALAEDQTISINLTKYIAATGENNVYIEMSATVYTHSPQKTCVLQYNMPFSFTKINQSYLTVGAIFETNTDDNCIYEFGHYNRVSFSSANYFDGTFRKFDMATQTWTTLTASWSSLGITYLAIRGSSVAYYNGYFYICGGFSNLGRTPKIYRYDVANDTIELFYTPNHSGYNNSYATVYDNKLTIIAGYDHNYIKVYDLVQNTYTVKLKQYGGGNANAVRVGNYVYFLGGVTASGYINRTIYRYDLATDTFSAMLTISSTTGTCYFANFYYDENSQGIYIVGGCTSNSYSNASAYVWKYDINTNAATYYGECAPYIYNKNYMGGCLSTYGQYNGKLFIFGGYKTSSTAVDTAYIFELKEE